jgi:acyl-CoA thioester hydrolase
MISASVEIQVEFYDVDAMKVAWHGNYARFIEAARNALFQQLDFGYEAMEASGYAWPVVDLHIRYVRSAILNQRIRVTATLVEWENRVRMEFLIVDAASGEKLTKADSVQVAVDGRTGELQFVVPDVFVSKVKKALA